jgi:signal transduction histidine kinase
MVVKIRPPSRRPLIDLASAALLMLVDLLVSFDPRYPGGVTVTAAAFYAIPAYAVLAWRRRFPGPVFVVVLAHSLLAWVIVPGYLPTLSVWLGLYTLAARCALRWSVLGLLAAAGPAVLNVADEAQRQGPSSRVDALIVSTVVLTGVNLGIFGIGRWVRWSLEQRRVVAEHAAADAVRVERGRIARDLHDVVAHSITLMVLQAGGAARLLRSDPGRAEVALQHVDDLGQQAIVELRRMLGLLASSTSDGDVEPPLSRLEEVATLVERARAGDLQVEFTVGGTRAPLDPGVELSVYRIIQEALTNAARYADKAEPVEVRLNWEPGRVDVLVGNHIGRRIAASSSTHRGLLGMRERASTAGGTLTAGADPDGRFIVRASLPVVRQLATTGPVQWRLPAPREADAG